MRKWPVFLAKTIGVLVITLFMIICENSADAIGIYQCGEYEVEGFLVEQKRTSGLDLILEKGSKLETVIHFDQIDSGRLRPYLKCNVRVRLLISQTCSKNCQGKLQKFL